MLKTYTLPLFLTICLILILIFMANNIYSHPIINIITIIIYRVLITLNISLWKINFIYSIILFLIIIRGLLIIFLYFSSLISNEQITLLLNNNKLFLITIILNIIFFIYYILNKKIYYFNIIYLTKESNPLFKINEKIFKNILSLYTYPFNNLTIICIIFLLISLFTIIKISSLKSKPLRKISN